MTLEDIETANQLAHEVLGRTLDELPPQTRSLLDLIHGMVTDRCKTLEMKPGDFRFSRRDVREHTGWGNTQLKTHLHRLEELEYLLVHRGGRGQSMVYELLYNGEGDESQAFMMGLIDSESLKQHYDKKKSGVNAKPSGSSRPQVGAKSGSGRGSKNAHKPSNSKALKEVDDDQPENAPIRIKSKVGSHDGQEVLVSQAQGCAGATRSATPAMVAKGAE